MQPKFFPTCGRARARNDVDFHPDAVSLVDEVELLAQRAVNRIDEASSIGDGHVVDGDDVVARADPGDRRGRSGDDLTNDGLVRLVARNAERQRGGKQDEIAEHEVRNRTREDNREPAPGRLGLKVVLANRVPGKELALLLGLGHPVVLALHRAVAADRERPERVLGAGARARPAGELRSESDREFVDPNAVATGEHEMAELVEHDEDRKHHEKRDDLFESDQGDSG